MNKQFVDYDTCKMLEELGMILPLDNAFAAWGEPEKGGGLYMGAYDTTMIRAYLWQQAKEWLWDKKLITIHVFGNNNGFFYRVYNGQKLLIESGTLRHLRFNSPITAEHEAIKKTVLYLYSPILSKPSKNE